MVLRYGLGLWRAVVPKGRTGLSFFSVNVSVMRGSDKIYIRDVQGYVYPRCSVLYSMDCFRASIKDAIQSGFLKRHFNG